MWNELLNLVSSQEFKHLTQETEHAYAQYIEKAAKHMQCITLLIRSSGKMKAKQVTQGDVLGM